MLVKGVPDVQNYSTPAIVMALKEWDMYKVWAIHSLRNIKINVYHKYSRSQWPVEKWTPNDIMNNDMQKSYQYKMA